MFTKAGINKSPIFNNIQAFRESLHFRRDVRQLGALAAHDAADERREGDQVPGDRA